MMNNLFSIFDPLALFSTPMNWVSMALFSVAIVPSYWALSNPFNMLLKKVIKTMNNEFETLLKNSKINIFLFVSLFFLLFLNNTMGLLSFTFTATSHLAITLSLALPMWLAFIMFSLINNLTEFLAHLVPAGTPAALMPFMVLIELTSNIIRPVTLSVRLTANMIAGHLLLTLLGNQVVGSPWLTFPFVLAPEYMLMILESAVACIQAYVFSALTTLYASEA